MLESAAQQRPGNPVYLVNFAWTAIEERRYEQALTTLATAERQLPALKSSSLYSPPRPLTTEESASANEILMAQAVAHWLAQNKETAFSNYVQATGTEPAWTNSAWYTPQYSPTVSRAISEMKAEIERRKKATETKARQAQ
jgi:hypothetical protein